MFVSKKQVTRHVLHDIADGSALRQYFAHPNVLLHSKFESFNSNSIRNGNSKNYNNNNNNNNNSNNNIEKKKDNSSSLFYQISGKLCHASSLFGFHHLEREFLLEDEGRDLPRIFIVSISFCFMNR